MQNGRRAAHESRVRSRDGLNALPRSFSLLWSREIELPLGPIGWPASRLDWAAIIRADVHRSRTDEWSRLQLPCRVRWFS